MAAKRRRETAPRGEKRYIGDAEITIEYTGMNPDRRMQYRGTIKAGEYTWPFSDLGSQVGGFPTGGLSPEAYDEMAGAAASFGAYYTSHNRGDDVPDWAPSPEVADAIDEAVSWAQDDKGNYQVRRSPKGKAGAAEHRIAAPSKKPKLDAFTRAYIEAALWSTNDESDESGGEPLDKNYDAKDIAPETMAMIVEDCADFQKRFGQLIEDEPAVRGEDRWDRWELAGHDFWLTREGHGAGFWDGDWPKHGDELTKAAKSYGEFGLYLGDDGQIYGPPQSYPNRGHRATESRSHQVADFDSLTALIEHAKREGGATHVKVAGANTRIYYPKGSEYEKAAVWYEAGYWHGQAPSDRTVVDRLPADAQPIDDYLARGWRKTAEAKSRTSRGRFAGKPVPAPNPGMNPFAPQAQVRLHDQWRLGDRGAVYEFNIKLHQVRSNASELEWEQDVQTALEEFERELRKQYPWIGQVYVTGRSGGWLAVEDPTGKMTKATLEKIAESVEAGKRQFKKDMEQTYPRTASERVRRSVRDYIAIDYRGRQVGGPFTDYRQAKREADRNGGVVKFAPGRGARENRAVRSPVRRRPLPIRRRPRRA